MFRESKSSDSYPPSDATGTAPSLFLTPEEVYARDIEMLCDLSDEDFASDLVAIIQTSDPRKRLKLLYEPAIKARVAAVLADDLVSEGILWPGLRAVPGFREADYRRALPQSAAAPAASAASIWESAMTAADFCAQEDDLDLVAHVKDLLLPGAITLIAAPRASFKSLTALALAVALATGGVFRGERLAVKRVLLVDRDNPPALVRKRIRSLGADHITGLRVITRNKAPVLTDAAAWAAFPVEQYDVVIIDSIGAATEGISEKEGRQTQQFLATLKDLAHRGPAILGLDNTNKAGANIRGRGEKSDAVDIVYECRNVTGWTPSTGGTWWEHLPEYGEHTWQQRAARQHGQKVLRLAFIPSKFRLGVEPEPFCLEIDTRQEPWTLRDVTEEIATAGDANARAVREQERQKLEAAAQALVAQLGAVPPEHPMLKREAETVLRLHQLTARQAKSLLEAGYNRTVTPDGLWTLRAIPGARGQAIGVYLPGEEDGVQNTRNSKSPCTITTTDTSISDSGSLPCVQNTVSSMSRNDAVSAAPDSVHSATGGCTKSEARIASTSAGESAAESFVHADPCNDDISQQNAPSPDEPVPSAAVLTVSADLWCTPPAAGPVCKACHGQDFVPSALALPTCRRCGTMGMTP